MLEYRGYLILTAPYHAVAVESKERSTLNSVAKYVSRFCLHRSSLEPVSCQLLGIDSGMNNIWVTVFLSLSFHIFPLAPEVASCFQVRCEAVALVLRGGDCLRYCSA